MTKTEDWLSIFVLWLCIHTGGPSQNGEVESSTGTSSMEDLGLKAANLPFNETDENSTIECSATSNVNISQIYQQLLERKKRLDEQLLHIYSMGLNQSTISEGIVFNLIEKYLNESVQFENESLKVNGVIHCQGNVLKQYEIKDTEINYERNIRVLIIMLRYIVRNDSRLKVYNESDENIEKQELLIKQYQEICRLISLIRQGYNLEISYYKYHARYFAKYEIDDIKVMMKITEELISIKSQVIKVLTYLEEINATNFAENVTFPKTSIYVLNGSACESDLKSWEAWLRKLEGAFHLLETQYFQHHILQPSLLGILFVIGIVTNGILLTVFVMNKTMRTAPNVVVINLTVMHSVTLIVNSPLYILESVSLWRYGNALCKVYRFFRHFAIGLSVYSVVLITFQRFLAVTNVLNSRGPSSSLSIILVWVLAAVLASPCGIYAVVDSVKEKCESASTEEFKSFAKFYSLFGLISFCIIPLLLITILSFISSKKLRDSIKSMPGEVLGHKNAIKGRALSSKILIALTVVFAVSYVPFFSFVALTYWFKELTSGNTFIFASSFMYALTFVNSCIDPIALYIVSRKYRKHMNRYLTCGIINKLRDLSYDASRTSTTTIESRM